MQAQIIEKCNQKALFYKHEGKRKELTHNALLLREQRSDAASQPFARRYK
jgi:hypothetical protein